MSSATTTTQSKSKKLERKADGEEERGMKEGRGWAGGARRNTEVEVAGSRGERAAERCDDQLRRTADGGD